MAHSSCTFVVRLCSARSAQVLRTGRLHKQHAYSVVFLCKLGCGITRVFPGGAIALQQLLRLDRTADNVSTADPALAGQEMTCCGHAD